MRRGLLSLLAAVALTLAIARAQSPPATPAAAGTPVTPTETQSLRLQVKQKDAIIAQQASQTLHVQANQADEAARRALAELQKLAAEVKTENKWGDDVQFEPNALTFTRVPEKLGDKPKPTPAPDATAPVPTSKDKPAPAPAPPPAPHKEKP